MSALELLKQYFGYDSFRLGQEAVIEHVMAGQDGLVIMPTGGGKSLCFQLPALMLDGVTLVVSPLISLMKDQVDALTAAGVPAAFINSTLSPAEIARIQSQALAGEIKLIYIAPERFAVPAFREFLAQLPVALLAVDEAHCISEWGHDFRPDYRNLQLIRQQLTGVPVLALTATATKQVKHDIVQQLRLVGGRVFSGSFDRPNLSYSIWPKKKAFPKLVGLLQAYNNESAIVYCLSRKTTEKLATQLQERGIKAEAYHAGLESSERHGVQERFIRSEIQVVVATIAFGMGIDKPDVRLIVHHDLPKTIESYYQETGRAGRDGLPSRCVLFFSYGDRHRQMFFVNQQGGWEERQKAMTKLDDVIHFCQSPRCRRAHLLGYFGEQYGQDNCGSCDVCEPDLRVDQAVEVSVKKKRGKTIINSDPVLFEKLRRLRKEIADEHDVPAFVIFGDRTLHELAAVQPRDLDSFAEVFGVGEKKLRDFGERFLVVLCEHEPDPDLMKEPLSATLLETKRLIEQQMTIEEVVEERKLAFGTIMSHLEDLTTAGECPDLSYLNFSDDSLMEIQAAFKQLETNRLAPVREALGGEYSYDELRLARLLLKLTTEPATA